MSAPTLSPPSVPARQPAPLLSGMVRLVCPLCGKRYKVSEQLVGRVAECLHCTGHFIIPPGLAPAAEGWAPPPSVGRSLAGVPHPHGYPRFFIDYAHTADFEHYAPIPIPIRSTHRWQQSASAVGRTIARRPVSAALGSLTLVLLAAMALSPQFLRNLADPQWWNLPQNRPARYTPPPPRSLAIENTYPVSSRSTRSAAVESPGVRSPLLDDDLPPPANTPQNVPQASPAPAPGGDAEITAIIADTGRTAPAKTSSSHGDYSGYGSYGGAAVPAGFSSSAGGYPGKYTSKNPSADPSPDGPPPESAGLVYWAPASDPVELNNVRIRLLSVRVGPIALQHVVDGMVSQTPEPYLTIELEVTNLDTSMPIDYYTWAGSELSLGSDLATMHDDQGQPLQRVAFTAAVVPRGRRDQWTIAPDRAMTDVLVFKPPQGDTDRLRLELPGRNVGLNNPVRFEIPASVIQH